MKLSFILFLSERILPSGPQALLISIDAVTSLRKMIEIIRLIRLSQFKCEGMDRDNVWVLLAPNNNNEIYRVPDHQPSRHPKPPKPQNPGPKNPQTPGKKSIKPWTLDNLSITLSALERVTVDAFPPLPPAIHE